MLHKTTLLICSVYLLSFASIAQNNPSFASRSLQLNFRYGYSLKTKESSIPAPSPAFITSNGKRLHEFELNTFSFDRKISSGISFGEVRRKTTNVAVRYQYTRNIIRTGRIVPQVGLSVSLGYRSVKTEPLSSYEYARQYGAWYSAAQLYPQVRFNVRKSFYLNLALPVDLWQGEFEYQEIRNPAIPIRQQRNSGYDDSFGPINSTLRIAIAAGVSL